MLNSGESNATTETSGQPGSSDWTEIDIISIDIGKNTVYSIPEILF